MLIKLLVIWGGLVSPILAQADDYRQAIERRRSEAEKDLRAPDGWLAIINLAWLRPGTNTIGTKKENEILLPADATRLNSAKLVLEGNTVFLEVAKGEDVQVNGKSVEARVALKPDVGGSEDVVRTGRLLANVIDRSGRMGFRIKDPQSANRLDFKGRKWFPIQENLRIPATFEISEKSVTYKNVLGQTLHSHRQGYLIFSIGGVGHRLVAEGDPAKGLFVVFNDQTNGSRTYGGGRFLDVDAVRDGKVEIDFNRAFNPPCAFTKFATCELAPDENHLDVAIEAGELKSH